MTPTLLLILALAYVVALFAFARYHEQQSHRASRWQGVNYALTLGVFCSSWTFYGAVGSMAESPWSHAPIYIGPILLWILFQPVVVRLIDTGHRQRVTSIADFIGARYGKRQVLAGAVAAICLVAVLPYLALQFRALQQVWSVVNTGEALSAGTSADNVTLLVALGLALFAILFGVRRLDGSERQRGLMRAIAVESLVKLVAFVLIAALASVYLFTETRQTFYLPTPNSLLMDADFAAQVLISALAVVTLPRQFHVSVVEIEHPEQARTARWFFPLYLLLFMLLAVPIAVAGQQFFAADASVTGDTYVQRLPMALDASWATALAFLGGISAATGMVLVATVSVSIMVTNELLIPLVYRVSIARSRALMNLGSLLRRSRQITVFVISLAAWLLAAGMSGLPGLTQIGFLSFLGSAQLAPALLLGLYWRRAHGIAVLVGMLSGAGLWLYWGVLPLTLWPGEGMPISDLVALSLGVNLALCVVLSLVFTPTPADLRQASQFIDRRTNRRPLDVSLSPIPMIQLDTLIRPLLSEAAASRFWRELETSYEQRLLPSDRAPRFVVSSAEVILANAVGATSARQIIKRLESERQLDLSDLTGLLGSTQQGSAFNRESLEAAVENLSHGVSVVDNELRLVAWNSRYESMFDYPPRFLFVGCPIERVYRFNADRGILSSNGSSVESEIERRLAYMREGSAHQVERVMPDGRVLDIRGTPVPGGGFVTTYVDVTEYREMTQQLVEVRSELEQRLASGEQTLSEQNAKLRQEVRLRAEAETQLREAYRSKAEFMAATSHDLLQPLNAARLFASSLRQRYQDGADPVAEDSWQQLNVSLERTERMISELREMARLDAGKQRVSAEPVAMHDVLVALAKQFTAPANAKGLRLRVFTTGLWVRTDAGVLQRILENLVSNAIKYTPAGGILLGVRRVSTGVRIAVYDTGPGIAREDQARVFQEFERLGHQQSGLVGLGLGLSLVQRYAALLDSNIELHSEPGRGSVFSLTLPRTEAATPSEGQANPVPAVPVTAEGARILLLDNDVSLLSGLTRVLRDFGFRVHGVATPAAFFEALETEELPDLIIADQQLNDGALGLGVMVELRDRGFAMPVIMISADDSPQLRQDIREQGFRFMAKPIDALRMRGLVEALLNN